MGSMARQRLPFFEENTEPLDRRIAAGLHKVGLAMKQQAWQQANEEGLEDHHRRACHSTPRACAQRPLGCGDGSHAAKAAGVDPPCRVIRTRATPASRPLSRRAQLTGGGDIVHPFVKSSKCLDSAEHSLCFLDGSCARARQQRLAGPVRRGAARDRFSRVRRGSDGLPREHRAR